jgi:hypothetical protein
MATSPQVNASPFQQRESTEPGDDHLDAGSGSILWQQQFGPPIVGSMALANDVLYRGTFPLSSAGGTVMALDSADGTVLWTDEVDGALGGGFSIADSTLFVGYGVVRRNLEAGTRRPHRLQTALTIRSLPPGAGEQTPGSIPTTTAAAHSGIQCGQDAGAPATGAVPGTPFTCPARASS